MQTGPCFIPPFITPTYLMASPGTACLWLRIYRAIGHTTADLAQVRCSASSPGPQYRVLRSADCQARPTCRSVIDGLFIPPSMAVRHSPAYLFAAGSAPAPPDGGNSWADYIPRHPSRGFTAYALRLTGLLPPAFGLGSPSQTDSPLRFPLLSPAYLATSPGVAPAWLRVDHAMRYF